MATVDELGFVPTEYISLAGARTVLLRRSRDGWKVCVWLGGRYEPLAEQCATVDEALEAYAAWVARAPDNDVDW